MTSEDVLPRLSDLFIKILKKYDLVFESNFQDTLVTEYGKLTSA